KLNDIAKALDVPTQAIKEYSDERMINIISNNTFQNDSSAIKNLYNPTFNPLDKLIEAYDENKKLYERLLVVEKEKLAYLEHLLKKEYQCYHLIFFAVFNELTLTALLMSFS